MDIAYSSLEVGEWMQSILPFEHARAFYPMLVSGLEGIRTIMQFDPIDWVSITLCQLSLRASLQLSPGSKGFLAASGNMAKGLCASVKNFHPLSLKDKRCLTRSTFCLLLHVPACFSFFLKPFCLCASIMFERHRAGWAGSKLLSKYLQKLGHSARPKIGA